VGSASQRHGAGPQESFRDEYTGALLSCRRLLGSNSRRQESGDSRTASSPGFGQPEWDVHDFQCTTRSRVRPLPQKTMPALPKEGQTSCWPHRSMEVLAGLNARFVAACTRLLGLGVGPAPRSAAGSSRCTRLQRCSWAARHPQTCTFVVHSGTRSVLSTSIFVREDTC
jgi:hypothetical protein